MTLSKLVIVFLLSTLGQGALADSGGDIGGNGGDACWMKVETLRETMTSNVAKLIRLNEEKIAEAEKQGFEYHHEFPFSLSEFREQSSPLRVQIRLVEHTYVDGQESDASSLPGGNLIKVSRRWCDLSEIDKQAILFHEFLVIMGVERTGYYKFSERFRMFLVSQKALEEENKLKGKWTCTIKGYPNSLSFPGMLMILQPDASSDYKKFYSPETKSGNGKTSEEAFRSASKLIELYNRTGCSVFGAVVPPEKALERLKITRPGEAYQLAASVSFQACIVPANSQNSCVQNF